MPILRLAKLLLFFTLITSFLNGCSLLDNKVVKSFVQEPSANVENISVNSVNQSSVELLLKLNVTNPNGFTLALAGYDYDIKFNGKDFLSGRSSEGFSVSPNSSNSVDIPLTIPFNDILSLIGNLGNSTSLSYDVSAAMRLDAPVLKLFNIQAKRQGSIDIPRMPQVNFGGLKFKSLNFTEVEFEVEMTVNNPNSFNLSISDLAYQFDMKGQQLASGEISDPISLTAGKANTVRIPVKLSVLDLGANLMSSLQSGKFQDYVIRADFVVNSANSLFNNVRVPINYQPGK